jgi:ribosomal-protein-alanine N-acetyltransferase
VGNIGAKARIGANSCTLGSKRRNRSRGGAGRFVGYCGVAPAGAAPGEIELLYASRPEFWDAGFTTRMARLAVDWAFREQDFACLVAYTMTSNAASRRVIEKTGFVYERDIEYASLPHVFFRLTRQRWSVRTTGTA